VQPPLMVLVHGFLERRKSSHDYPPKLV